MLEEGLTYTQTYRVTEADTAISCESGDLPVLATPRLIALLENASMVCVKNDLTDGDTTVGGYVELSHVKPTAVSSEIVLTAKLERIVGRKLHFVISAREGDKSIGNGSHIRVVVNRERFMGAL